MRDFPYRLSENPQPVLGLIVLRVDETIESDFRRYFPPDVAHLHVTRLHSGDDLTPESIGEMENVLTASAALLPPAAQFDVIGYGCTSGTAQLGAANVRARVAAGAHTRHVTNPLTAALAAVEHLDIRRIGIVSPYVAAVAAPLCDAFAANGVTVTGTISFGEEVESRVARIDPQSIAEAARALASDNDMDGLFLSCTNLRTAAIRPMLEAELGMPVLSSNQVLAWHMALLAGIPTDTFKPGEHVNNRV